MIRLLLASLVAIGPASLAAAALPREFLRTHCLRCHGAEKQQSDRRFDRLTGTIATLDELESWQEIVDQLNLSAMPPEDATQPTESDRATAIESITTELREARTRLRSAGGHTVLRRLNAHEYRYTLGDLLGLNVDDWHPAADFPAEELVDGLDNDGAALVTSGLLLERQLLAAEEAIRRATHFDPRPRTETWSQRPPFYFAGREANELPKLFHVDRFRFASDTGYTDLTGRHYRGGHLGFRPLAEGGVPHAGRYTVRVRAAAVDRTHHYGRAIDDFVNGDPLVLELVAVDRRGSVISTGSVSRERSLASVELTDEEPRWFTWDVTLDVHHEPELRFRNGTASTKALVRKLTKAREVAPEIRPFAEMSAGYEKSHGVLRAYRGPKLRIFEVRVSGPHVDEWPPRGHRLLYGDLRPDDLDAESIVARLRTFAAAAFRRPVREGELEPVASLVRAKLDAGIEPLVALQLGFQAILCAPGFQYLDEGTGPLDQYALASRLSYFLWSGPPDAELRRLASRGVLADADILGRQVERMLADDRSDRFVSHFVRRWLGTDSIGEMPPSRDFEAYHRDHLGDAMRIETESFLRYVLDENLPPSEFLSADYSFLNRELARHYGIDGIEGSHHRRVSLAGVPRGGLLGQGLLLTASANGVDTSPVVRGVYLLEKLLGDPPPPPPPDVPAIASDIRGAETIREQLEKHRSAATCAACHRNIDPLGFALENFDAVGGWRENDETGNPIDAGGRLPGGDTFESFPEFRRALVARSDRFARCLAEKLLAYALGRRLDARDRPDVDRVTAAGTDGGLREMLIAIVTCEAFGRN